MFKNVRNISFDKLVWMEYSKNLGMYLNEASIDKQLMRNQKRSLTSSTYLLAD